jgi:elongation factor P--(R)-beta-lysine ligase
MAGSQLTPASSPWWDRRNHADRRPLLAARMRIKQALRQHFEALGFTEVECAALQISPGNEAHLHAFATDKIGPDDACERLFLHTSPEFACKKLLAAGERRIFTFSQVYRNREQGALNVPEFTMLEWYRAEQSYDVVVRDCGDLLKCAAAAIDTRLFRFRGRHCDATAEPKRISVAEAFRQFAAINILETLDAGGHPEQAALARAAVAAGIMIAENDSWGDIFSRVLTERIESNLGIGYPVILDRYPRCEAALARVAADDPRVSERFELYVCGVEVANGFGELTDADEQRRRFEAEMALKQAIHGERYPIDEDFLAALRHMPQASGVALGFDRLVMLATAADNLRRVMWTPPAE